MPPRDGRCAPNLGCNRPAIPQATPINPAVAAKIAAVGATYSTAQAMPGVTIDDTSRKLE